ncbi:cell division protein [Clostridium botulinum B str. Osaka05]|uniref:Cell division protein n=1 Tax=Clostridium botulinum B str. Osaka05 TaxID=1407017 RepID=A0A060N4R4_CLOBO|nr:hypothetical protein [Clostridium botulinum]BAO04772.1 cell division protein [Clostridium botulinum B str. Osaka05]
MIKFICDCCGKEVNDKKDLNCIEFYSFKWEERKDISYKEVCEKCYDDFMLECGKAFEQLKDKQI